jgi:hypothetical protein
MKSLRLSLLLLLLPVTCVAAKRPATTAATTNPSIPVDQLLDARGRVVKLIYRTSKQGDRVPDFSTAGYMAGDVTIPDVPAKIVVPPIDGDSTASIQRAIDYVATLPPDNRGVRGAVLLQKGKYTINGGLRIGASGVILRGSGFVGDDATTLFAAGHDRRTLFTIAGKNDRSAGSSIAISDSYLPVNATQFHVADASKLKQGDRILIRRTCTAEWIKQLGMDNMGGERHGFGWKPGTREIMWDRTITAIKDDSVTIDSPITTVISKELSDGSVSSYTWPGRISQVGVENLRCDTAFDEANPKDEAHSWFAITIENAQDAWVRQTTMSHFVGSAVAILESCKRITVEDCKSLAPVSEIAGQRRQSFFTAGQQTLFQRCLAENGRHDFSVGFCAAGPNAFVQCDAINALDDSGPIDSWASGVLYDNVHIDGNALNLYDRRFQLQGAGWAAANSMLWQSTAAELRVYSPPTATNWAQGCWGQFDGTGEWASGRESVHPASLYYGQLADRIGAEKANARAELMMVPSDPSSNPPIDVAQKLIAASAKPAPRLTDWIDQAAKRHPIPNDSAGAKSIEDLSTSVIEAKRESHPISIENGWIIRDGAVVTGLLQGVRWWAGGVRPYDIANPEPSPTRFVPGRNGPGLIDNLDQLTDDMRAGNRVALDYHYGLWYDVRDADHERIRRMDGDVWPPFYEYPFARSGTGTAWDGLSKYDLTKYNLWYFDRVRELADRCDEKGLVLLHHHFFQHNIIEAGAHWASCPWRTANNVNNTGFPEPPPYAGDKRIFMSEQFYDLTNTTRRDIYRAYIRKCLEDTADNHNVIHLTSAEFTGPLHFTQFWLDTAAEWQKETGKKAIIGLACTKDVQDAILADPERAKTVSAIVIQYWWYQTGTGEAYAPPGGENLSPRQHERITPHKGSSFDQVLRAVREYRQKFPDKAVIYMADGDDRFGLAALVGGASLAQMPRKIEPDLLAAAARMKPVDLPGAPSGTSAIGDESTGTYLVYLPGGDASSLSKFKSRKIENNVFFLSR